MKRLLLLAAVLLLSSCAENPSPESTPASRSMLPEAVTNPSPASTEGALTQNLQDGWSATLQDSLQSLQELHNQAMSDLRQSLSRARVSPPTTGPAGLGR